MKKNTIQEQFGGVICLGPTGTFQGTYNFLFLKTGDRITRQQLNELPVPDSVVKRVKELANNESDAGALTLFDIHGDEITDNSEHYEIDIENFTAPMQTALESQEWNNE